MICALASKSSSWLLSQYALLRGLRSTSWRIRQRLERLSVRGPAVIDQLFNHPLTNIGLEKFLKDWEKSQAVKV